MSLRIRFRGGELAGRTYEFDDDVERIVIGRDPERCQVVLPADMTQVGREHMALRRSLARYRLSLNTENPVFVDGEPALDNMELPEVAQVQLGPDGPSLVVQTVGAATVPETMYEGEVSPDVSDLIREAARSSRWNRKVVALVLVAVLAIAGVVIWGLTQTASVKEEQQRARIRHDDRTREIERLTEEHRASAGDLQRRVGGLTDSIGKITPDISRLRESVAGLGPRMQGLEERIQTMTPRMNLVLAGAKASVYVVVLRDARDVEHALATAWVAKPGVLATNAHVAEFFARVSPGGNLEGATMFVLSPGASPRKHEVKAVTLHPGYQVFLDLWMEYRPTDMSPEGRLAALRPAGVACDVALLEVADGDDLAPPLDLAPLAALHTLDSGDVVGFVGYPTEEMSLGGVNLAHPSPTTQIAHITAVTNYFLAAAEPVDSLLVQHSLPVTGGASGSPILNEKGEVVAVLSAGNIEIHPLTADRAPSAVLVNFAQRSDLVKELLDDQAADAQVERTKRWRDQISTLMSLGSAAEKGALAYLQGYLELVERETGHEPDKLEEWSDATSTVAPATPWSAHNDREFSIPSEGVYVFFAYGLLAQDVNLAVLHETDDTKVYGREASRDWYSAVRISTDAAAKVRVRAIGPTDAEYRMFVYRFGP